MGNHTIKDYRPVLGKETASFLCDARNSIRKGKMSQRERLRERKRTIRLNHLGGTSVRGRIFAQVKEGTEGLTKEIRLEPSWGTLR